MIQTKFDTIGDFYERDLANYSDCRLDHVWLMRNSHLRLNSHVLEINGGLGFLTTKIADVVAKGEITVQDVSPTVLGINAEKLKTRPNIHYFVESDMNLPSLPDEGFDSILSLGGFHRIEDQVRLFKSIFRKLKKNGVVCLGDFEDGSSMQRYFDEKVHAYPGLFASSSRLLNLARFAGFDQIQIERKKISFCFSSEAEIGDFFQLLYDLDQDPHETYLEVKRYFDIVETQEHLLVLMDYIYAAFRK